MKYLDQLTDNELIEYYKNSLLEPEGKVKEVKITRTRTEVELYAVVEVPEFEEELKSVQATTELEDLITFTDYEVIEGRIQRKATKEFRKYMYEKFGNSYAEEFLFAEIE